MTTKIAFVTDDGQTVSRHFGRAKHYVIFRVEAGQILEKLQIEKPRHDHQHGHVHLHDSDHHDDHDEHAAHHAEMFALLQDCDVVITRGIGDGARQALTKMSIRLIITDFPSIEDALQSYLNDGMNEPT